MRMSQLQERLAALGTMSVSQLRAEWTRVFRKRPPDISADILARSIAYRLQERALGSLTAAVRRQIKRIACQLDPSGAGTVEAGADLKPGTRLGRDWRGKTHHVLVLDEGFLFDDRKYSSLSQIANVITGTRWSGPRFFGLVKRKTARSVQPVTEDA